MNRKLYNQVKYFNTFLLFFVDKSNSKNCFKIKFAFDFDLIINFEDIKLHFKDV